MRHITFAVSEQLAALFTHTGVQSSLYVRPYLCSSVYLSVSLSGHPRQFLEIIRAACNFTHSMQPQSTGSNPLSGSIICPSVHPSGHLQAVCGFLFVLIYSVGVQRCDVFIPTLVYKGPQWGPVKIISTSVCPYLCTVIRVAFWRLFVRPVIASSACGHRPWVKIP